MTMWAIMVVVDLIFEGPPAKEAYFHAVTLAVVFAGYIAGWSKEILGGILSIGGTLALFALCYPLDTYMGPEAVWLATPGVFYILAHYADKQQAVQG
jgi:hypothetical protein